MSSTSGRKHKHEKKSAFAELVKAYGVNSPEAIANILVEVLCFQVTSYDDMNALIKFFGELDQMLLYHVLLHSHEKLGKLCAPPTEERKIKVKTYDRDGKLIDDKCELKDFTFIGMDGKCFCAIIRTPEGVAIVDLHAEGFWYLIPGYPESYVLWKMRKCKLDKNQLRILFHLGMPCSKTLHWGHVTIES